MKIAVYFLFLIIIVALISYFLLKNESPDQGIKTVFYRNIYFNFRDDVDESQKIPIINNSNIEVFRDRLFYTTDDIYVLYKNGRDETNSLSAVEALEVTQKLKYLVDSFGYYILGQNHSVTKTFISEEIQSYENLKMRKDTYSIVLIPPEFANNTFVKFDVKERLIYISGKTKKEFDLAAIKFVLTMIGDDYKKVGKNGNFTN